MASFRHSGPTCQTMVWYDGIDDGTMARTRSSVPSSIGFTGWSGVPFVQAAGSCAFLNPVKRGTVRVPQAAFDRLRKKSPSAKVSQPKANATQKWPEGGSSAAVVLEITIGTQTIKVVRPTAADEAGKNLPTTLVLAEALRAIPSRERAHTDTVYLSAKPHPDSKAGATIAGAAGSGDITLFPMSTQQSANDFDNRLAHESGHNLQGQLWKSGTAVKAWGGAAASDRYLPSGYAGGNTGDDFCEFNILFNAAKGSPCESEARRIYPHRWKKRASYP
jgi:hypothetical protein